MARNEEKADQSNIAILTLLSELTLLVCNFQCCDKKFILCIVLYWIVLYCIVLYHIVLYVVLYIEYVYI